MMMDDGQSDAGFVGVGVWLVVKRPGAKFAGGSIKKRKLLS
jgi:hypothetical protein